MVLHKFTLKKVKPQILFLDLSKIAFARSPQVYIHFCIRLMIVLKNKTILNVFFTINFSSCIAALKE